jgi:hypothetical protein
LFQHVDRGYIAVPARPSGDPKEHLIFQVLNGVAEGLECSPLFRRHHATLGAGYESAMQRVRWLESFLGLKMRY